MAQIKNVVLVHGAFTDGSSWTEVIVRLQALGYTVTAVQNPLTSLADDVAATRRVLKRQDGPVVLVGHSWGGAVITEAGTAPNVAALVYVSALAPDQGEAVMDLQRHGPPSPGMQGAKPDADGLLWFDPAAFHDALAADVRLERAQLLAATQQPVAGRCFADKLSGAAWRDKPSWYLLSQDDRALAPELQAWMAQRMKASVVTVPSSHMSLISHADDVVRLVEKAARAG
ncbi:alpha/beta hydrolase [Nitrospirillum sp. BR 11752]|uniref:alpha/beta fold hydrolase n=1 Tax=Nitrospirillum sp. BR 11752 TaxID=3104293 RepID=UPI002EBF87E0|nr:alpha/beta hydrolase [Nitrospirillum sp. BR 11752]